MACSHGSVLPGDGGHYGDWSDFEMCPHNTAVCGIRTLGRGFNIYFNCQFDIRRNIWGNGNAYSTVSVEDPQGVFTDDTSLNQIILYCCDV